MGSIRWCTSVAGEKTMRVAGVLRQTCLLFALSVSVFGQVNTATVSGSVTDPSHAQVPGAQLQLQSELTGGSLSITSNSSGQFTFSFIPVAVYTLPLHHPTFPVQSTPALTLPP